MRYLTLYYLLFWAGTQVQSQKLEPTSLVYPDSLGTGSSVVLEYDVDYEVTSRSTATVRYRKVTTLLNNKHEQENVLRAFYDGDSKITDFEAASYDGSGKELFRARSADISDRRYTSDVSFYEDNRYKEVTVPCNSYPCTVVFEVEQKLTDFMAIQFPHWQPQQFDQAVVESRFTATIPLDNELLYDANRLPDALVGDDGKVRTYRWSVQQLTAPAAEPYAPPSAKTLPYLRLALADFEIEGHRGSFRSWADFGAFMRKIMDGRDRLPPVLATQVHELTATAESDYAKIDRLYRFMQERMRYVSIQLGLGGWQPFPVDYVEQNRFGDCKALSNYMGAMLSEVGIESYPVLINWNERQYYPVEEDFTTSAFNHMVLYVPSEDMYLECTSNDAPTGYLGEDKQDRNVLWITPTGGELHRTPKQLPTENGHARKVTLAVAGDGSTHLDLRATYYGGAQEFFRGLSAYREGRRDQLELLHQRGMLPDVSGTDYNLSCANDTPKATLSYTTKMDNYARKMGSRLFVPINAYHAQTWVPEPNEDRQLPIQTQTTRLLVDTIELQLPESMEIESGLITEPVTYAHAAGEYHSQMQPTETGLQWVRTLKLLPVTLPATAYVDYRQFFLNVSSAERAQIVLRERRTK